MGSNEASQTTLRKVLQQWSIDAELREIRPVAAEDGYSGAKLWKVSAGESVYCLRAWPAAAPLPDALGRIHGLMSHLAAAHPRWIGAPHKAFCGSTWVAASGRRWELAPWMPGEAPGPEACTRSIVVNALSTLAELHRTAESFAPEDARFGRSPGLARRRAGIEQLAAGGVDTLRHAVATQRHADATRLSPGLVQTLEAACRDLEAAVPTIAEQFHAMGDPPLPQHWRIGDVRREHVLFVGGEVTGVIDFGAACVDSVAGDVARLLGSMAGDDPVLRQAGLTAYEACRPLSDVERHAVELFDAGGLCVAVSNWLRWVAVEGKRFGSDEKIAARLGELGTRLSAVRG